MNSNKFSRVCSVISAASVLTFSSADVNGFAAEVSNNPLQGKASGYFSVNGKKVQLKYAYAMIKKSPFDEGPGATSVLLTTSPLTAKELEGDELFFAMSKTEPGILYQNDEKGTVHEVIVHPGVESGGTQRSGIVAGKMNITKSDGNQISGTIEDDPKSSSDLSEIHFKYSVKASFTAPLPQVAPVPQVLNTATGSALPDGGGEPGTSLIQFFTAIKAKDLAKVRALHPDGTKMPDEELNQMAEMYAGLIEGTCRITKGFEKGESATLYVECKRGEETGYGMVILRKNEGKWILDGGNQRWSNVPFDEAAGKKKAAAKSAPATFKDPYSGDGGGTPLAAGGGKVGALFLKVFQAIVKKDYNKARSLLGEAGNTDSMFFSNKAIKTLFLNGEKSTRVKIAGGFSRDEAVTLFLDFSGGEKATVEFRKRDQHWAYGSSRKDWEME
jgi:hypothetical protein